jgi:hypothetical protein
MTGIVGLLFFLMPYIGIVLSILAIVFHAKANKFNYKNGMSTAGLILGIIGTVINAIILIILLLVLVGVYLFESAT